MKKRLDISNCSQCTHAARNVYEQPIYCYVTKDKLPYGGAIPDTCTLPNSEPDESPEPSANKRKHT